MDFKYSVFFLSLYSSERKNKNLKMVVGESQNGNADDGNTQQSPPQTMSGLKQATIDNIMSGIENTGAVKMNNHRKKLRQR
jgi:hypothetical protein